MPCNDMSHDAMVDAPSQTLNIDMDKYNSTPEQLIGGSDSKGEMNSNSRELGKTKIDGEYDNDNVVGSGSGNDQDNDQQETRKHYHRYTPQQLQELERFFNEDSHPNENQRLQLSKKLDLTPSQIRFWFQNRRSLIKTKLLHQDNVTLRGEQERLEMENRSLKEAMTNGSCYNCGGPSILAEMPLEKRQLWVENVRLRIELERVAAIVEKMRGKPFTQMASLSPVHDASPSLITGSADVINLDSLHSTVNPNFNFLDQVDVGGRPGSPRGIDKSYAKELAVESMNELIRMVRLQQPFWIRSPHNGIMETLNYDEYFRQFPGIPKRLGYRTEANRDVGTVLMNSMNLVEIFMNSNRYSEMFSSIVSRATTLEVLCDGVEGTMDGQLQLMHMELHVLSPLGPVREFYFLRFCQQIDAGVWVVADFSADSLVENSIPMNCMRQPSGLIIENLPGNCSKVTWVEHIDYDDRGVPNLYRSVVNSGLAFGSQRWLSTLQHKCECLALIEINAHITDPRGPQSLLKLAQRMTVDFCGSLNPSMVHNWATLSGNGGDEDIRVSTRKNMENAEFPGNVVLCAATSVWLPITPQELFDFLRDLKRRSQWDMLSTGETEQEITRIMKGQDPRNSVSLLASNGINTSQTTFILQECCADASVCIIVYAPVDMTSMDVLRHGGESDHLSVLPYGFVIFPDGLGLGKQPQIGSTLSNINREGSILTVAFQILLANKETPRPAIEDVQVVQRLISHTLQKIISALILENA